MPGQSLWVQGITPGDARLAAAGLLATNSNDPGDIRTGILFSGQQTFIGSTSGLNVTVLPLHFVGSKAYSNGAYLGFNPTTATVAVPAAPTLGSKRIDVLYVVQQDANALVSTDATTSAVFGVKTGVASSTPSKPALTDAPAAPVGAVEVGTITWDSTSTVATATNAAQCSIVTTCQFTAVRGRPIPVRNATERGALSAYDGMSVFRIDNGVNERSFGGVWRQEAPFAQAQGSQAVTTTSGSPNIPFTVTLPGIFTVAPNILLSWSSSSGFEPMLRSYLVTSTNFGVNVISAPSDIGPVSGTVFWQAIQTTSTTA